MPQLQIVTVYEANDVSQVVHVHGTSMMNALSSWTWNSNVIIALNIARLITVAESTFATLLHSDGHYMMRQQSELQVSQDLVLDDQREDPHLIGTDFDRNGIVSKFRYMRQVVRRLETAEG